MEQRRRGSGWIGWLVFLLFILAPSILPPVAQWLSQQTGLAIGTTDLFIAIIVMLVIFSIGSSVFGALRRSGEGAGSLPLPGSDEPFRLPSGPGDGDMMRTPPPPPEPPRLPRSSMEHPGAPRVEPLISGRILLIGIVGLFFLGLFLAALFVLLNP